MWPDDLEESRERFRTDLHILRLLRVLTCGVVAAAPAPAETKIAFANYALYTVAARAPAANQAIVVIPAQPSTAQPSAPTPLPPAAAAPVASPSAVAAPAAPAPAAASSPSPATAVAPATPALAPAARRGDSDCRGGALAGAVRADSDCLRGGSDCGRGSRADPSAAAVAAPASAAPAVPAASPTVAAAPATPAPATPAAALTPTAAPAPTPSATVDAAAPVSAPTAPASSPTAAAAPATPAPAPSASEASAAATPAPASTPAADVAAPTAPAASPTVVTTSATAAPSPDVSASPAAPAPSSTSAEAPAPSSSAAVAAAASPTPPTEPGAAHVAVPTDQPFPLLLAADKATYKVGEKATVAVTPLQACNLSVLEFTTSGEVHTLYPNASTPDAAVAALQTVFVAGGPSANALQIAGPVGSEQILAICTPNDGAALPVQKTDAAASADATDVQRDLALVAGSPGAAMASVSFAVQP